MRKGLEPGGTPQRVARIDIGKAFAPFGDVLRRRQGSGHLKKGRKGGHHRIALLKDHVSGRTAMTMVRSRTHARVINKPDHQLFDAFSGTDALQARLDV
ncbi:MAG: hypothetical protein ACRD9W_18680, partial [Terriglobia bacterium]